MYTKNKVLLLLFIGVIIICLSQPLFAQGNREVSVDTSNGKIRRLTNQKLYYNSQLMKSYVSDSKKEKYKKKLEKVNNEFGKILVLKEETDLLELNLFLSDAEDKLVYAQEAKSAMFCLGGSYIDKENTLGAFFSGEKFLSSKLSLGLYAGFFKEKIAKFDSTSSKYTYVNIYTDNYNYPNVTGGLIFSYHFFNISRPTFRLDPQRFDFYLKGIAGYNLITAPVPYLKTDDYHWKSEKSGMDAGGFLGVKYLLDDNLGFFVEGGYSKASVFSAGLIYRVLPKERKQTAPIAKPVLKKK